MIKLSKRHLTKPLLSKRAKVNHSKVISEMREKVKKDPTIVKKFEEYGVPLTDIDHVHISFCPLDVSAKTKNQKIYINEAMLDPDSGKDPTHYLVHELIHYLQQSTGKAPSGGTKADDYLDKPTEEEAFEAQVDFKKREDSPEEAEEYVENLLDYHDIKGKERKEKKEKLMDKE